MSHPFLQIELELPDDTESVPLCRHTVVRTLALLGVEEELIANIELTVTEAASNVVRHAHQHPGHRYRVSVSFFVEKIQLRVEDDGQGFARDQVPEPDLERCGGRGLWLMEQLATFLSVSQRAGLGSFLEATFALPEPLQFPPPEREEGRKGGVVIAPPVSLHLVGCSAPCDTRSVRQQS